MCLDNKLRNIPLLCKQVKLDLKIDPYLDVSPANYLQNDMTN